MCEPISIATAAIGVGAAVAGAANQASQASKVARFQNQRYTATTASALNSYGQTLDLLGLRNEQESIAATQQSEINSRQYISARSKAAVMAASAGVGGNSLKAAMNTFSNMEHEADFNIWRNREWQRNQIRENMEAARINAQNQISGAAPGPVQGPSMLALGLGVAGGVMSGVNAHMSTMTDAQRAESMWTKPLW